MSRGLLHYNIAPTFGTREFSPYSYIPILNAGGYGTTDWTGAEDVNNIATGWQKITESNGDISKVTGFGFNGTAIYIENTIGTSTTPIGISNPSNTHNIVSGRTYTVRFKYIASNSLRMFTSTGAGLVPFDFGTTGATATNASFTFTATGTVSTYLTIYLHEPLGASGGEYVYIDAIELIEHPIVANYELASNANDQSGNAYNATPVNITYPLTGRYANGIAKFNGTNSTLKPPINASTDILINNTHTVCGWLKYGTKNLALINRASLNFGGYDGGYICQINGDNFIIRRGFGTSSIVNSIPLSANGIINTQQNFYLVMYDKTTGILKCHINGKLLLNANYTTANVDVSNPTYDQGYHIGSVIRNSPLGDTYTDGSVGRWKLYNRLLTMQEIHELFYEIP